MSDREAERARLEQHDETLAERLNRCVLCGSNRCFQQECQEEDR